MLMRERGAPFSKGEDPVANHTEEKRVVVFAVVDYYNAKWHQRVARDDITHLMPSVARRITTLRHCDAYYIACMILRVPSWNGHERCSNCASCVANLEAACQKCQWLLETPPARACNHAHTSVIG